jgi:hypothetical protein
VFLETKSGGLDMSLRDLMNHIDVKCLFAPKAAVTDNTAQVSAIIDVRDCKSVTLALVTGVLSDVDATFAVLVEEGDDSALADNAAVADDDLIGTEVLAGFTFALDSGCRKIGYRGSKRYIRVTVTPTNNAAGNLFLGGIAILEKNTTPTANPPV